MRIEYIIPVLGLLVVFGAIAFMWWELQQNIKDWKASQDEINEWFEQRNVYWDSKKEKQ